MGGFKGGDPSVQKVVMMNRNQVDAAWVADALVQGGPVHVGEPDLTELLRALRRRHVDRGTVLYCPATPPSGVSIIRSGRVELSQGSGAHRRVVGLLKDGDVLGDVALLQNASPPFTARCLEDTELWFLPADQFRRLIATYPSLAVGWLCNLASRLQRSRRRTAELLGSSLPTRLACLLLREATDGVLHLPQRTIAEMLGVQRTSVNKILNQFGREGLIGLGYGTVVLQDARGLRLLASGAAAAQSADEAGRMPVSPGA